jgi:hypothetical protein
MYSLFITFVLSYSKKSGYTSRQDEQNMDLAFVNRLKLSNESRTIKLQATTCLGTTEAPLDPSADKSTCNDAYFAVITALLTTAPSSAQSLVQPFIAACTKTACASGSTCTDIVVNEGTLTIDASFVDTFRGNCKPPGTIGVALDTCFEKDLTPITNNVDLPSCNQAYEDFVAVLPAVARHKLNNNNKVTKNVSFLTVASDNLGTYLTACQKTQCLNAGCYDLVVKVPTTYDLTDSTFKTDFVAKCKPTVTTGATPSEGLINTRLSRTLILISLTLANIYFWL